MDTTRLRLLGFLAALSLAAVSSLAAEDAVSWGGSLAGEAAAAFGSSAAPTGTAGMDLRLNLRALPSDAAKVEAAGVVALDYSSGSEAALPAFSLKKLFLSVYAPFADFSVGRQILNYGRGTALSPADLFTVIDPVDLSRSGSDAVRVKVPFTNLAGLELVSTLTFDANEWVAGARGYGVAGGWNLAAAAYWDGDGQGSLVGTIDVKGDLVLGISAEAVARMPVSDGAPRPAQTAFSGMLGLDYSFARRVFLDLEYQYLSATDSHQLFSSLAITWTDSLAMALHGSIGGDGGAWAAGTLSWNLVRGVYLTAFARYLELQAAAPWTIGARVQVVF